jgi:hypothetical protein
MKKASNIIRNEVPSATLLTGTVTYRILLFLILSSFGVNLNSVLNQFTGVLSIVAVLLGYFIWQRKVPSFLWQQLIL